MYRTLITNYIIVSIFINITFYFEIPKTGELGSAMGEVFA